MKCSRCSSEMQKGYIPVHRGMLYWAQEGQRIPWNSTTLPKGGVKLSDSTITLPKKAKSYYCSKCNIVVTPVPE